jgi:hypothetical protein
VAGARQIVDGPAFTPLPYSLWGVVQQRPPTDPHWQQGVTWQEWCPQVPDTMYDECLSVTGTGSPPPFPTLPAGGNVLSRNRGATPFTLEAEFDCSPVGQDLDQDRAADALRRLEDYTVENAFWTGVAGGQTVVFPHLAANAQVLDRDQVILQSAATPVVSGAGVDATDGLGRLEAQLSVCYGGQGIIHIPALALPTFVAWSLVHPGNPAAGTGEEAGRLYTTKGNLVVPGGGYAGTGPDGSAPAAGNSWIYATGAVFGYRSEITGWKIPETLDRAKNTVHAIAQRTYVLGYECCLLAALIATGVPASPTV